MTLLSIDPGLRGSGVAIFSDGRLVKAAYVRNIEREDSGPYACAQMARTITSWVWNYLAPGRFGTGPNAHLPTGFNEVALEWPTMYGGRASRGDARDLLPLAGVDAALSALCSTAKIFYYVPHEWKGSIQKPKRAEDLYPIEQRVKSRLSKEELDKIEWPGSAKFRWDVADGIGIGLYRLGRFERTRVMIHR